MTGSQQQLLEFSLLEAPRKRGLKGEDGGFFFFFSLDADGCWSSHISPGFGGPVIPSTTRGSRLVGSRDQSGAC